MVGEPQEEKAESPMEATLSAICTEVTLRQLRKALAPMWVTPWDT